MSIDGAPASSLSELLIGLTRADPSDRIQFREPILAYGAPCIEPLVRLASKHSELAASIASWLETLAGRNPDARQEAVLALRRLAAIPGGTIVTQAVIRLQTTNKPAVPSIRSRSRVPPKVRRDAGAEVHARLINAAKHGRILTYSELETGRGHVGKYLRRIVQEEADAGHPPLTAIVVSKSTGHPGDGFMPAMLEIGYAQPGDALIDTWRRAVLAVHAFWGSKS
jgi:hypothetical protein